jgi:Zn-dependent peptidase ImmA (M78 family)
MARSNPVILRCRIPRKVKLPFGYVVTVRQFTNKQMNNMEDTADGLWNSETRTIYIRKSLPLTRKRYILMHELGHAWLDFTHHHLDDGKAST